LRSLKNCGSEEIPCLLFPETLLESCLKIAYLSSNCRSACLARPVWKAPNQMYKPLVAVSTDVRQFENYTWHAAPQQYLEAAIVGSDVTPVLVPNFGDRMDIDRLLASVDGIMITGSKSNVHPSLYGEEATEANGPYDTDRDATTLPLIRKAIERGVPLLAICRGIQEMNVALGGTLGTEIQEREGSLDHRAPVSDKQD